jgi:hypothetical protein
MPRRPKTPLELLTDALTSAASSTASLKAIDLRRTPAPLRPLVKQCRDRAEEIEVRLADAVAVEAQDPTSRAPIPLP